MEAITIFKNLELAINAAMLYEVSNAGMYLTKQSIGIRTLHDIVKMLPVEWDTIFELKNLTYVLPEYSKEIELVWKIIPTTVEENNVFEKFLCGDFHRQTELVKLATILYRRVKGMPEAEKSLNALFAVDGYDGYEYKNYIANIGIIENPYQKLFNTAVRKLYTFPHSTPDKVHEAIVNAFRRKTEDDTLAMEFVKIIGSEMDGIINLKREQMEKKNNTINKKQKTNETEINVELAAEENKMLTTENLRTIYENVDDTKSSEFREMNENGSTEMQTSTKTKRRKRKVNENLTDSEMNLSCKDTDIDTKKTEGKKNKREKKVKSLNTEVENR